MRCVNCDAVDDLISEYDIVYCPECYEACDWLQELIERYRREEALEEQNKNRRHDDY